MLGSGNMATQLCHNFYNSQNKVIQVYNRTYVNAKHLESICDTITDNIDDVIDDADLYIISVNDSAIEEISLELRKIELNPSAIVAHTSGSASISLLVGHHNSGVFYPLQSVNKERILDFKEIPILLTVKGNIVTEKLQQAANLISNNVHLVKDDYRSRMHIPAVLVNNFTNYMYILADEYCKKENLDFNLLRPLILETAERMKIFKNPKDAQTGPAVRNDHTTLSKHRSQLNKYPEIKLVYNYLTKCIKRDLNENS